MIYVDFKEDFKDNLTACLGCETIITFADLWYGEYCCKRCFTVEVDGS